MEFTSNYERQCEEWRQKIAQMDIGDICRRVPEVEVTEEALLLWHFGRQFAVDQKTGAIRVVSDDGPLYAISKLNIYTLFWYAKEGARRGGQWVTYRELKGAAPFWPAFQRGTMEPIALTFSGRADLLDKAVEKLRGEKLSANSYQLWAFRCIPVRLKFWDGDEEFPAQVNLLFDSNATEFNHEESIATIAAEGMYQLADAAGLELKGSPFVRF